MQKIIHVTIKGTAPLLQHRFADEKQTDEPVKVGGMDKRLIREMTEAVKEE